MPTPPDTPAVLTATIVARRRLTHDVVELTLGDPDGRRLPEWTPGAHIDVHVPDVGVRQYSLCSAPDDAGTYRIAVLRERDGRGGSAALHDTVESGSVGISEPRNNFELVDADRYVFVAGGIGITPILAMVADADRRAVPWELHYGGQTADSMVYRDELRRFGERVRLYPQDEVGMLPLDTILAGVGTAAIYCCGPAGLITAVENLSDPASSVHVERFSAVDVVDDEPAGPCTVRLAASGRTIDVPTDQSILDALESAGIAPIASCREGTCASCETTVLEGEVLHRDSVLTAAERSTGRTMMVCVSRARSKVLVLDL